jgi:hypothetical protein
MEHGTEQGEQEHWLCRVRFRTFFREHSDGLKARISLSREDFSKQVAEECRAGDANLQDV